MKNLIKQFGLAVAIAGCAIPAYAVPTLRLTDNYGNTLDIADESVAENLAGFTGVAGAVGWSGSIGHWTLLVESGTTDPITGTSTRPDMFLHATFNLLAGASTQAGEWLKIEFSDEFTGPTSGNVQAHFSSTFTGAGATVGYNTYGDANSTALFTGGLLTSQGPVGPGASSSDVSGPNFSALGSPYTLTQSLLVTAGARGASVNGSSNDELTVPDGGMTLMLLGSSLTALGLFRCSFGRKA